MGCSSGTSSRSTDASDHSSMRGTTAVEEGSIPRRRADLARDRFSVASITLDGHTLPFTPRIQAVTEIRLGDRHAPRVPAFYVQKAWHKRRTNGETGPMRDNPLDVPDIPFRPVTSSGRRKSLRHTAPRLRCDTGAAGFFRTAFRIDVGRRSRTLEVLTHIVRRDRNTITYEEACRPWWMLKPFPVSAASRGPDRTPGGRAPLRRLPPALCRIALLVKAEEDDRLLMFPAGTQRAQGHTGIGFDARYTGFALEAASAPGPR